jgi:hypothetical protein
MNPNVRTRANAPERGPSTLKTAEVARLPWVRIPPPPHFVGHSARFAIAWAEDRVLYSHAYSQRDGIKRDQSGRSVAVRSIRMAYYSVLAA